MVLRSFWSSAGTTQGFRAAGFKDAPATAQEIRVFAKIRLLAGPLQAACLVMALFFSYAAYVQINDPDWYIWLPLYGSASALSLLQALQHSLAASRWRDKVTRRFHAAAVASCFALQLSALCASASASGESLGASLRKMVDVDAEIGRECLGASVVSAWFVFLMFAGGHRTGHRTGCTSSDVGRGSRRKFGRECETCTVASVAQGEGDAPFTNENKNGQVVLDAAERCVRCQNAIKLFEDEEEDYPVDTLPLLRREGAKSSGSGVKRSLLLERWAGSRALSYLGLATALIALGSIWIVPNYIIDANKLKHDAHCYGVGIAPRSLASGKDDL
eukprot:jgi/Mesen1/8469/ME000478S07973